MSNFNAVINSPQAAILAVGTPKARFNSAKVYCFPQLCICSSLAYFQPRSYATLHPWLCPTMPGLLQILPLVPSCIVLVDIYFPMSRYTEEMCTNDIVTTNEILYMKLSLSSLSVNNVLRLWKTDSSCKPAFTVSHGISIKQRCNEVQCKQFSARLFEFVICLRRGQAQIWQCVLKPVFAG